MPQTTSRRWAPSRLVMAAGGSRRDRGASYPRGKHCGPGATGASSAAYNSDRHEPRHRHVPGARLALVQQEGRPRQHQPPFFRGARIGVIGPNGSGKSSLLKVLAGVDTEFEGQRIVVGGHADRLRAAGAEADAGDGAPEPRGGGLGPRGLLTRYEKLNEKLGENLDPDEMQKVVDELERVQTDIEHTQRLGARAPAGAREPRARPAGRRTRTWGRSRGASGAAWRSARCCSSTPTCCCSTSPRTTSTPTPWTGSSGTSPTTRAR